MKYIGITLGPINDTLKKAQKTREIWGASYMFAYICKEILKMIDTNKYIVLLPDTKYINATTPGVGLFPDRILLALKENGNFVEINTIIKEVKENIAKQLWNELNKNFTFGEYTEQIKVLKKDEHGLKSFFYDYFKSYAIEADSKDLCFVNDENELIGPVKSLNLYLDNAELMPSLAHYDPDPFYVLLHFINHSFLVKDAFGTVNKNGFPSLTEIATNELQFIKKEDDKYLAQDKIRNKIRSDLAKLKIVEPENMDDENTGEIKLKEDTSSLEYIFKEIPELNNHLRTYHKYIAIVHADGDNMGKLIGTLNDDIEIQKFSADLVNFSYEANRILAGERFTNGSKTKWGYGAAPIYIGGDELVFFAPVASINEKNEFKTVFDLVADLDNCFEEIFNKKKPDNTFEKYEQIVGNRPCMTYGISITYYKFPLREAFEQSKELMYAVKNDNNYKSRNRLHFVLQKHSKQNYYGIIDKNFYDVFKKYLSLLNCNNTKNLTGEKSDKFLNSIHKKIIENYGQYLDINVTNLEDLFEISFNEKIHKEFLTYLKEVREWIEAILKNQGYDSITLNTIVSMLKFIHFIRDNEFRH